MAEKKKSTKKTDKADDKKSRTSGETARRIWLAGIGAYGRAFTEAQEALKDVTGGTSKVFDDLVQKGEMIETAVSIKRKDLMDKAGVPSFDLDDRISKMRSRLSRGEDVARDIEDIEVRLDVIEGKLDAILTLLKSQKTPKRATTTRTRKS